MDAMSASGHLDLSSGSPDRPLCASRHRGSYRPLSLDRSGSFRENMENPLLSSLPNMSRSSSSVTQGDVCNFFQCLRFDPKSMVVEHKLNTPREFKRLASAAIGIPLEDSLPASSKSKQASPSLDDLRRLKSGLRESGTKARERVKIFNDCLSVINKWFPTVPSRKRSCLDALSDDQPNTYASIDRSVSLLGSGKMGSQNYASLSGLELEQRESEERSKNAIQANVLELLWLMLGTNSQEDFSSGSPISGSKLNANARAPRSASVGGASKLSQVVQRSASSNNWGFSSCTKKIPGALGANNRKHAPSTQSSSPSVANWVQRPQKISRTARRTHLLPIFTGNDEKCAGDAAPDVMASEGRLSANSPLKVKIKGDNFSPAALSESEESGATEIMPRDKNKDNEIYEGSGQDVHELSTLLLPPRKSKVVSRDDYGDGVRKQRKTGRGVTSTRALLHVTSENTGSVGTTKQIRSSGLLHKTKRACRPPTRKLSDRKAYTRKKHIATNMAADFLAVSDDGREELLAAANAVIKTGVLHLKSFSSLDLDISCSFVDDSTYKRSSSGTGKNHENISRVVGSCVNPNFVVDASTSELLDTDREMPNGCGFNEYEREEFHTRIIELIPEHSAPTPSGISLYQRLVAALISEEENEELLCGGEDVPGYDVLVKKGLVGKLLSSASEAKALQEKEFEGLALDKLVLMTYENYTRCSHGTKTASGKMAKQAALALVRRALERCREFEATGKSCFGEPLYMEMFLSGVSCLMDGTALTCIRNKSDKIHLGDLVALWNLELQRSPSSNNQDVYSSEVVLSANLGAEPHTSKEDSWSNGVKRRELLLDDVSGTISTSLGGSLSCSAKGKRSGRDRERKRNSREGLSRSGNLKIGRPSSATVKGDRKSKTKPKPNTADLPASVNGPLGKMSDQSKVMLSSTLSRSVSIDLDGQGDDLGSWFNSIDDDGLQDHDYMGGLGIPKDNLADLNMMV
ncbi:UNVERIFIED_CONTAM: hypothetical protein Scaly_2000700 [Sesamum calycinum]|uniref:Uncharacterized protein n=1 Tax=Sesamum calycinum TaxID=2727403 RepID=A0AAW2N4C1_9LAMI